ncbi:thiamine pyrophosphate-dependent dehydrogenase E1 component subunit alpha [Actinophytocola xanthii]|uniref:ABC transporter substrate-binding protein n=1 Tax=Actinophytocola xanthii TaxID=1912961 RepID=A0A1Q8CSK8_9PSEU|nr:thiamine pyrophosphate-dependent dehydrogenase E1 component subunit alpha [Actinophytocola xanthii]OLF17326.1 ABC transporter substrate-binding protein [Actinophytocola xanthii]
MATESAGSLGREELIEAYRVMRTIRAFEERVHTEFASGELPGAVHLYAGQEAVAAGVCGALVEGDYIASTHRGHGHAIAKGCDIGAMMRELYGKAGGSCNGKGGSMHIADFERGMLGANGVAAGGAPLACGSALSAKVLGKSHVSVAFVGDGAANQGSFSESLNLATVWQLPVVFVVEDNFYAQATGTRYHLRGLDVARRAEAFGMPAVTVDGTDYFAVRDAAATAVERARSGGGPSLVECKAGRFFGHMEGFDQQGYRGAGEVDRLRAEQDCLVKFVTAAGLSTSETADVDVTVDAAVEVAVAEAKAAPSPELTELLTDVYVSY